MKLFSIFFAASFSGVSMVLLPLLAFFLGNIFELYSFNNLFIRTTGLICLLLGLAIFLYCSQLFKTIGKGTPVPVEPPKKLVVEGLYKYSRNPIYVGYWLILIGESLILGQILVLIYSIIFIVGLHLYIVCFEEEELRKRFGEEYTQYLMKVPRYFSL
jgi:protein-S-isoprenylcysteine O-methyltransferase Ste14